MKGSRFALAIALTLALSGAALAQDKDSRKDDRRAPVQTQQQRRPAVDHGVRTQPASQWQQGRDQSRDEDRNRATAQWQQERRDGDHSTAQWEQERRDGDRDRDGDDRYRGTPVYTAGAYYPNRIPNGVYGRYGTQALSGAQQIGYQDGLNDGRNDRATGHSFRPTEDSNYRHADRGWNASLIDRNSYSNAYRQAYMQGYQRGYGGWSY